MITTLARRLLATLLVLIGTLGVGTATVSAEPAPPCTVKSAEHVAFAADGATREYSVRIPPGGATTLTPMVVSLHPLGFTLDFQRDYSLFGPDGAGAATGAAEDPDFALGVQAAAVTQRLGDREGFIAVFPQGRNGQWDLQMGGSDTAFLPALVEYLHARGCSAPQRTSINGYSMGAMMTSRVICARPDLFTGAAMVSGVYPPPPGCRIPARMSIVGIHGTADQAVYWDGTIPDPLNTVGIESFPWDRPTMMRMWAEAKGCARPITGSWFVIAVTEYTGCAGSTTHMVGVYGGAHGWSMGGMSASEYIWDVLKPPERRPVLSATVALHRAVGAVGTTTAQPITAGSTLSIDTGVVDGTVLGTLTATGARSAGHLRAYPCDAPRPNASALNFLPGATAATGAAVHTGADGRICIYTSGTTNLLWDQASGSSVPSHSPVRHLDTRGSTPVPAGGVVEVQSSVPLATVLGTVTATEAAAAGHIRLYPCDQGLPPTSVLNYQAGLTTAAGAAVRSDANGRICLYSSAATNLIWDQVSENDLPSHQAQRLLDTRRAEDGATRIPAGGTISVDTGIAAGTVLGTLTAVGAQGPGHLRVYACDQPLPNSSALSVDASGSRATGVASGTSADGRICIFAAVTTHVIWDQVVESAGLPAHNPERLLDTRL